MERHVGESGAVLEHGGDEDVEVFADACSRAYPLIVGDGPRGLGLPSRSAPRPPGRFPDPPLISRRRTARPSRSFERRSRRGRDRAATSSTRAPQGPAVRGDSGRDDVAVLSLRASEAYLRAQPSCRTAAKTISRLPLATSDARSKAEPFCLTATRTTSRSDLSSRAASFSADAFCATALLTTSRSPCQSKACSKALPCCPTAAKTSARCPWASQEAYFKV